MKKLIIAAVSIIAIAAVAFIALKSTNNLDAQKKVYEKDELSDATIALLDDPNYKNVQPAYKIDEAIQTNDQQFVYFFSPDCVYCAMMTPTVAKVSSDMGIDIPLYNLLEFQDGRSTYNITAWPVLIAYKDGQEVDRLDGVQEEDVLRNFLEKNR